MRILFFKLGEKKEAFPINWMFFKVSMFFSSFFMKSFLIFCLYSLRLCSSSAVLNKTFLAWPVSKQNIIFQVFSFLWQHSFLRFSAKLDINCRLPLTTITVEQYVRCDLLLEGTFDVDNKCFLTLKTCCCCFCSSSKLSGNF